MTTYVSLDVETTGPCPGVADLLSIGAVAFTGDVGTWRPAGGLHGERLDQAQFYVRLLPDLVGWRWNMETQQWWETQAEYVREEAYGIGGVRVAPGIAALQLNDWLHSIEPIETELCFIANPAGFDWQWINDLCWRWLGRNPFGYRSLCLRSMGFGLSLDGWGRDRTDDTLFHVKPVHAHHPLDDAIAQAETFRLLRNAAVIRATPRID